MNQIQASDIIQMIINFIWLVGMDTINHLTCSFRILRYGKLGTNGKEQKMNLTESLFFP